MLPLSVIKIVKYCGVGRGGGDVGGVKILQKVMPAPLSVSKIVKYCDVWEGGGGAKILQKIMALPLSVVRYLRIVASGDGGALGGGCAKILKGCINLQLPIVILKTSILLDMQHHKTYMYINFQKNQVKTQVMTTCTQIYSQKIASCISLQLLIIIFQHRLFQTCIIVKCNCISIFSKIGLVDQSKPCTQIYLQKNCKIHKFVTCN